MLKIYCIPPSHNHARRKSQPRDGTVLTRSPGSPTSCPLIVEAAILMYRSVHVGPVGQTVHRCYCGRTLNFPFKVDMQDRSSCEYAQQHTEENQEIHTRRSAALTEVLNLASRNCELKSLCCDMLPASIEPRPSGMCVISVDPLTWCRADDYSK
jgi:hypothetical protein